MFNFVSYDVLQTIAGRVFYPNFQNNQFFTEGTKYLVQPATIEEEPEWDESTIFPQEIFEIPQ